MNLWDRDKPFFQQLIMDELRKGEKSRGKSLIIGGNKAKSKLHREQGSSSWHGGNCGCCLWRDFILCKRLFLPACSLLSLNIPRKSSPSVIPRIQALKLLPHEIPVQFLMPLLEFQHLQPSGTGAGSMRVSRREVSVHPSISTRPSQRSQAVLAGAGIPSGCSS